MDVKKATDAAWAFWKIVGVGAIIALLILIYGRGGFVVVSGRSMEPTYHDGDVLHADKVKRAEQIMRGDVIVFDRPGDPSDELIKRVIGLPGETLVFTDDGILADGLWIPDAFAAVTEYPEEPITLGENQFYVMGDNRQHSVDSRVFGPVDFDLVRTRAGKKAGFTTWLYGLFSKKGGE